MNRLRLDRHPVGGKPVAVNLRQRHRSAVWSKASGSVWRGRRTILSLGVVWTRPRPFCILFPCLDAQRQAGKIRSGTRHVLRRTTRRCPQQHRAQAAVPSQAARLFSNMSRTASRGGQIDLGLLALGEFRVITRNFEHVEYLPQAIECIRKIFRKIELPVNLPEVGQCVFRR